jgi:RNA polymerase sigma factor (sigma-70 family)
MTAQIDRQTIQNFKEGKQSAFNVVFRCFFRPITYFCISLTGNKEDGEEIALQAFHKMFRIHDRFETEANIKAFLYITAKNACIDNQRTVKRQQEQQKKFTQAFLSEKKVVYQAIETEIIHAVYLEISKLPAKCRKIFTLLYMEDLTPKEVAEQMKISLDNVYSQKKRAVQMLRVALIDLTLFVFWIVA